MRSSRTRPALSLRALVTTSLLAAFALAATVAVALVVITTTLRVRTVAVAAALEDVHHAQSLEIGLLMHGRTRDPLLRLDLQSRIEEHLEDSELSESSQVREHVALATNRVEAYLQATDEPGRVAALTDSFAALEALVAGAIAQANAARSQAERWDAVANVAGISIVLVIVVGLVGLSLWQRRRVLQPVQQLHAGMQRLASGDRSASVPVTGPAEVADIAERFNAMVGALRELQDRQQTFLAGVAHDLRNPLSAMHIAITSIRDDQPLPPEERIRRILGALSRQVRSLDRMVGDLLDAARLECGQLQLQLEPCDAVELVRDATQVLHEASPLHRIELDLSGSPLPVQADAVRVTQVLGNLLSNAVKYSPTGGAIRVSAVRRGPEAVVAITDEGVGLDEDERRRVFEPFVRVGALRGRVSGSGLGLFIARQIMEHHRGRLEVDSVPGSGSTFRLVLPLVDGEAR